MTARIDKSHSAKLLTPPIIRMMNALAEEGFEARVVGGAVRDVVMQRTVGDRDLAVNAPPQRVIEILAQTGIKTVATGLAHGTITAVIDRIGYEITTLRRDVETDGRHAQVEFTDDWRQDAARRDFTFNALYCDAQGNLYDFFDGIGDAKAGRVRYIGDAQTRIREDILRILRFFRFFAWYGQGEADAAALSACRELADLIPRLSIERVAREILKLLAAPNPAPAWKLMMESGVANYVTTEAVNLVQLQILLGNEQKYGAKPDGLLRFAALLPHDETAVAEITRRLKLSNRDGEKLCALAKLGSLLRDVEDPVPMRRMIYAHGAENCRAALLLMPHEIAPLFVIIDTWENPPFPVRGEDIVKKGVPVGAEVGRIQRDVEKWWIDNDFRPDRKACLAQIEASLKAR